MTVTPAARPRGVERPTSSDEARDLIRDTSGPLVFRGQGTKLGWGGTPREPAQVVETTGLTRVLDYNPADMTVSAQAGTRLRDLQQELAKEGQWLALDPPSEAAGATLGGLLATGDSGPRRLRYGGMRDLVIGATLVLADGTVVRAGGKVIKNVAGYDLSKLLYGSLGTLGLVTEVVVRLHPRPETSATVGLPCSIEQATELARELAASPLEPAALDWIETGGGRLSVRFEGTAAGVDAQRRPTEQLLGAGGSAASVEWFADADEEAHWEQIAARHRPGDDATLAFVGALPSRTPLVARALREAGDATGASTELASRPALGLHTARFGGSASAVAAAFESWRGQVLEAGATVLLHERPDEVDALVDAVGPAPSSVALLRALAARFDPHGRCAPGRFGSWY